MLPLNMLAGAVRFDHSRPGWTLLDLTEPEGGPRVFRGRVEFERPFSASPVVQMGVTGFDIDNGANARLNVAVLVVDEQGFDVEVKTWWDSRLWSVDLSWLAIGH